MFLTKECDYGIRIVRALADLEIKNVRTICECEYMPRNFAYKILKKLENVGIVKSHRGPYGGYQLAKKSDSITLFDIIDAIDAKALINECLYPGNTCPNNSDGNYCGVHSELERIQALVVAVLKEKTMDEVI